MMGQTQELADLAQEAQDWLEAILACDLPAAIPVIGCGRASWPRRWNG
jgi:hypothetical protein